MAAGGSTARVGDGVRWAAPAAIVAVTAGVGVALLAVATMPYAGGGGMMGSGPGWGMGWTMPAFLLLWTALTVGIVAVLLAVLPRAR